MKITHHNFSDDKDFCAAVVGETITTYTYFNTLREAQFHATSNKYLLGLLGIEVEVAVFEREQERKIEGFYKHELN